MLDLRGIRRSFLMGKALKLSKDAGIVPPLLSLRDVFCLYLLYNSGKSYAPRTVRHYLELNSVYLPAGNAAYILLYKLKALRYVEKNSQGQYSITAEGVMLLNLLNKRLNKLRPYRSR